MSFESDLIQSPTTKSADALKPELFFAPPPQHTDAPSPELFDQEVAELDLDFAFEPIDEFFTTFRDSMRPMSDSIPFISTPLALTYSTVAVYGATSSYCSSDFTQLDHSILSKIESYSLLSNGLYGTHDSIHSLPVHVTPASGVQMAHSPSSKRKHNLKTHIGTHNKSKPFECSTCGCRFSRKNDLRRHCRNPSIHRKQMSASSISKRRFDPNPDLPHGITINGDSRLTTSAYPDPMM